MKDLELTDFLSKGDLDALRRPVGEAVGLPGQAYGAEFFALEQRRLFPRSWCAVAFEGDIPAPGDARPVDLAGWPLLVVRGKDGQVRAFHNVCRHRGMQVVAEPCSALRTLTCPWHGWTYGLDGQLLATPRIGGRKEREHPEFDSTGLDLKPVPTASWRGFVFVNIAANAPPFEEHIAPLADLLFEYDHSDLRIGDVWQREFPGNWKIVVEGAIEDYHLPLIHPELVRGELESNPRLDYAERCFFANSSAREYKNLEQAGEAVSLSSDLPPMVRTNQDNVRTFMISVFPTAFMVTRANYLLSVLVLPDGHDRSRLEFRHLFKGAAASDPAFADLRRELVEMWGLVFDQDMPYVHTVQKNHERPGRAGIGVRFSPFWEANVLRFQQTVVDVLRD